MSNAIKVEENHVIEPSEEAQIISERLIDLLGYGASSFETAVESLMLAYTNLVVHQEGPIALHRENAKQMLEMMFNFSLQAHADCIGGDGSTHTH